MKVALFYNDDAGAHAAAGDIVHAIERHGHRVVHVVEKDESADQLFEQGADLVVAAGGDGTVASVARAMAGHDLTLAVLPLGTANNIAISLGCEGSLDDLIAHWAQASDRAADLGLARGPWGERRFVEAVGGGLVTRSIAAISGRKLDPSYPPGSRIEIAIGGYLNVLSRLVPEPWAMVLDDARVEGDFLLVAVLNIGSIGPRFVVSEKANPFDGRFTVAYATEADRESLVNYWEARMAGEPAALQLRTYDTTRVVIERGSDLHIDDKLYDFPRAGDVDLTVEPGLLHVLTGPVLPDRDSSESSAVRLRY